jgi:LPS-assembly protein
MSPASAQEDLACRTPAVSNFSDELFFAAVEGDEDAAIVFEAGNIDAMLGPPPRAALGGGVLVRRGQRLAGADTALYDPDSTSLALDGNVRFRDPNTSIRSDSAIFSYATGRVSFRGAEFQLGQGGARGAADEIELSQEGTLRLGEVNYTTCPPGSNDWLLQAESIELDTTTGQGTARNVALRFQGIPFLYSPRLTFPLGDARKTGFLAPEIGSAGRSGSEIRAPYYWNIAENYDATLTPRLLTDRGIQVVSEFRYLTERNDGMLQVEYLPDDDVTGETRTYVGFNHRTLFANGWRNLIDVSDASDGNYFEDLRATLSSTSITHLNRSALFDYYGENWSFLGRVQDYQTIDETIPETDQPYRRLPQLRFSGELPGKAAGVRASLDAEVVNFDRSVGVTGWRMDLQPKLDWSIERAGWFVNPELVLQHTRYELDNTAPGQDTDPSRTLPISSIDSGMILERRLNSGSNWIQTLEPRMLYVHTPFREQSELPVFDTITPDVNLVQLFRKNRFLGVDRIADTDQLSIGVTSRVLDGTSGEEVVTATIGQTRYLSEQGVTLPDGDSTTDSSDYVAELTFLMFENFNFDIGHQWGSRDRGTTKSEARLQYRPARNKILNLAYRFRRGSLEQGDVSWSWPLAQSWNFVGRYNYSLRDKEVLEQFYGLEYESCCWGLRLVSRQYVSTREGTQDSSFGLQLVLKGMASVGTGADRILERGILGYSSDVN